MFGESTRLARGLCGLLVIKEFAYQSPLLADLPLPTMVLATFPTRNHHIRAAQCTHTPGGDLERDSSSACRFCWTEMNIGNGAAFYLPAESKAIDDSASKSWRVQER